MNKKILSIMAYFIATTLFISCSSTSSDQKEKDGSKTVTAKFLDAGGIEGEISLTFEKEDGTKIGFFRNYTNPEEPKLNFEFVSEEGFGGNPELIGKTFIIKYIEKPNGGPTGMIGEGEPCNQILSVEKK